MSLSGEEGVTGVFDLLAVPVQRALRELGFSCPTAAQTAAIPEILKGENLLLIAPTGSGKTEAVLLPVFSNILQGSERLGISVLYLTPLRALNRDMVNRLSHWAAKLGITAEVRHGDTEIKIRRHQASHPPDVLVTTPETLQAILPGTRMREHLRQVRHVIIDEVHELAEDKRGVQLTVALERLTDLTSAEFQRVGLSATVGNPESVARFIAGTGRPIKVLEVPLPKGYRYVVECPTAEDADYELAQRLSTTPEAAARLRRILDLARVHTSTLIFANSRTNVEMLGHRLGQMTSDIAVHHGSLSREERTTIEDQFKSRNLRAIVCTSTLELGIDIGHVDLVIQYLSPRRVSTLIQRVGRSGHRLDLVSKGIIITAFSDDVMESIAAVRRAYEGQLEPLVIHEGALDVLAHQVAGVLMDKRQVSKAEVLETVRRAYPFRNLTDKKFLEVASYLHSLREVFLEGDMLQRGSKTREYYYENLSMIPDERRYPIIDVISDRTIGDVGDEFMALRARVGLNIIIRGKVWRIVQIEDESGSVYVVPSEDPMAAVPGWDGEILPVPYSLAQEVGRLRKQICEELKKGGDPQILATNLAKRFSTDRSALLKPIEEVLQQMREAAPVPTHDHILIEAFDRFVVVHGCYGEVVNRTLGSVFDAVLSDRGLITGWWNDGYRILIELPRKAEQSDLQELPSLLFGLSPKDVETAFDQYLKARFPFSYKMKFVAERFGALPRGRTMGPGRLAQLPKSFEKTPVYEETLREAMLEKVDIRAVIEIMRSVKEGKTGVSTQYRTNSPTPLGYHILSKYAEIPELMAPERVLLNNIERMRRAILAKRASMLCLSCGSLSEGERIRELPEILTCRKCGSGLVAGLPIAQDSRILKDILKRRLNGGQLTSEELRQLTHARRTADLILSYGKKALIALQVKGIGPETAFRILSRMHRTEDDFYMDLLRAKIQFLRTRPFWNDRTKRR